LHPSAVASNQQQGGEKGTRASLFAKMCHPLVRSFV
jgi:hypothetical protein